MIELLKQRKNALYTEKRVLHEESTVSFIPVGMVG
jgi:hypothetical protein